MKGSSLLGAHKKELASVKLCAFNSLSCLLPTSGHSPAQTIGKTSVKESILLAVPRDRTSFC